MNSIFNISQEYIPGGMFGANFVISVQICEELLCGHGKVYGETDKRMDKLTQATTFGLKVQGVKKTMVCVVCRASASHLLDAKPMPQPMQTWHFRSNFSEVCIKIQKLLQRKCIYKCCLQNIRLFFQDSICYIHSNFNEGLFGVSVDINSIQLHDMMVRYVLYLTHWGLVTPFGDIDLGQH